MSKTAPTKQSTDDRSGDAQTRPLDPMSPADAATLIRATFGIVPVEPPVRLDTERDDTFRVRSRDGDYILKLAHPDDDPKVINLQTEVLQYAAEQDPTLPLYRIIPALDGHAEPVISLESGQQRVARILTFLPGIPLRACVVPTPSQLQACGRMQARLAIALKNFEHPAADRYMMFDLKNFNELRAVRPLRHSSLIARVFDWFDEVLTPHASNLPAQVVHMDFGLDNVLVDTTTPDFVCGILDWGDVVRTWRAADLASGLASQVAVSGPAWDRPTDMIKGYQALSPLTALEIELLPGLVAMRIAQRVLMAERLSASMSNNTQYLRRNVDFSYQQLNNLNF